MLMPKRVKFRKMHRGRIRGRAGRGNRLSFGDYGLQALTAGWISARQIEAGRVSIGHFLGPAAKMTIRIFPHKSVTKKPVETRMGHGKGEPEFWIAEVKPGTVLFEVSGVAAPLARQAMARVAQKVSVRTRFVTREAILAS